MYIIALYSSLITTTFCLFNSSSWSYHTRHICYSTNLPSTTIEHLHCRVEQLSLRSKTRELSKSLFLPKRSASFSTTPTAIGLDMSSNQTVRSRYKPRHAMPLVTKGSQGEKDPKSHTFSSTSAVLGSSSAPASSAAKPIPGYLQPTQAFRNMAKIEIAPPATLRVRDRVQAVKKGSSPRCRLPFSCHCSQDQVSEA